MLHVLCVDDSPVVRSALTRGLATEGDITVRNTANDPHEAVEMLNTTPFDVIVLDAEMPKMDGLTFLKLIRQQRDIPVVMCSSLARRSPEFVLASLRAGASQVVPKPHNGYPIQTMFSDLRAAIRTAAQSTRRAKPQVAPTRASETTRHPATRQAPQATTRNSPQPSTRKAPQTAARQATKPTARHAVQAANQRVFQARTRPAPVNSGHRQRILIAVGASTGGIQAFEAMLRGLPVDSPGIVVAQHLPAAFVQRYADRLNQTFPHNVSVARDGAPIEPGSVYIAPATHHLTVAGHAERLRCQLVDRGPVNHHRPSVDVLFESVAVTCAKRTVAVLLTGMGRDGANGLLRLKNRGARTICQNEQTSTVFGMPRAAIELGAAQETLALNAIAGRVLMHVAGQPQGSKKS